MSGVSVWVAGNGGHATVTAEAWSAGGGQVAGFVDRAEAQRAASGRHVITEDEFFGARSPADHTAAMLFGIGCVSVSPHRMDVARKLLSRGACFHTVIHPRATVSPAATVEDGTVVLAGAIAAAGAQVGRFCILNHNAVVDHDAFVEEGVHVAPGAILGGEVVVGAGSMVGAGAVIKQGVRLGAEVMVGAGAVVLRDVPARTRVAGSPARTI